MNPYLRQTLPLQNQNQHLPRRNLRRQLLRRRPQNQLQQTVKHLQSRLKQHQQLRAMPLLQPPRVMTLPALVINLQKLRRRKKVAAMTPLRRPQKARLQRLPQNRSQHQSQKSEARLSQITS